ncbi:uncharacterized protein PgNI_00137 [Pyricularia grisea]|uniref:Uncharacterized protein n=1 Tax=Pyricularia grisea TaxID=148305 RepID=A0A6P8BFW5_PYRGI|nr:uncharacterized protein PgNI_00137 [Pyricularia grisea]TLD15736.1 hypothetical protein PgNI_00137 [Pyricularia grisea]
MRFSQILVPISLATFKASGVLAGDGTGGSSGGPATAPALSAKHYPGVGTYNPAQTAEEFPKPGYMEGPDEIRRESFKAPMCTITLTRRNGGKFVRFIRAGTAGEFTYQIDKLSPKKMFLVTPNLQTCRPHQIEGSPPKGWKLSGRKHRKWDRITDAF